MTHALPVTEALADLAAAFPGHRHRLLHLPSELVCLDCMEGDHRACRDNAGYMHEDTPERCGCHLTSHALDNREARR